MAEEIKKSQWYKDTPLRGDLHILVTEMESVTDQWPEHEKDIQQMLHDLYTLAWEHRVELT